MKHERTLGRLGNFPADLTKKLKIGYAWVGQKERKKFLSSDPFPKNQTYLL